MEHESRQAGTIKGYEGRGVWVPDGLSAADIMVGADTLERIFEIPPYRSRDMVREVLTAIAQCSASAPAKADL
jgi:hypothetical protein